MNAFIEIGLMLAIATAMACLMHRLRQPLLLGHILTGILVGPAALDILHAQEAFDVLARIGITALLFIVGIGLSPKVARDVGKAALTAGLGQILCTTALGFGLGLLLHLPPVSAFALAVAFTFSSTIIVSKALSDTRDLGTLYGRLAIGILLVQDVVATLLLIALSAWLQGSGWQGFLVLVPKALVFAAGLWAVARLLLPRLAAMFATSQEFLLLFTISWGCGVAALAQYLGLSMEIGALAAGVALASSPYQFEIAAKMKLLRDVFVVLFFILLGSQLSFGHASRLLPLAGAYSAFVLIADPLIVMALLGALGYGKKTSFMAGLTVAQVSEFSLLIVLLAVRNGRVPPDLLTLTATVALVTIAASTVLLQHADRLYRALSPALGLLERRTAQRERQARERFDAILFGCHRVGADFLPSLAAEGGRYLVVDFDPDVVRALEHRGVPVRYGDAEDNEFLDELDLKGARLIVSTLPDVEANDFILEKVRRKNRSAIVITVAQTVAEAEELYRRGASYVVMPHYLGGNHAALLLHRFGTDAALFKKEKAKHAAYLAHRRDGEG